MRFIWIFIFLVALTVQAHAQSLPVFTETSDGQVPEGSKTIFAVGTELTDSRGNWYKYVRNTSTVLTIGDVVCYSVTNSATQSGLMEVTKPATANLNVMAGVALGAIPATDGTGWIQTQGYCATVNVTGDTDIVLGDSLKATDGQWYAQKDQAIGTEATYARHIIALEAYTTASAATKKCFIMCR